MTKPDTCLHKLVSEEYPELIPEYKKLQASFNAYHLDASIPKERSGVCGLWIQGPPNAGKTHSARQASLTKYNEEPFILADPENGWFDGYKGQKVIIIEDLDHIGGKSLGHKIKLWTDKAPVQAKVK